MPLLWRPDRHRGVPLLIIYVKDAPFPHLLATLRGTKRKREQAIRNRGVKRSLFDSVLVSIYVTPKMKKFRGMNNLRVEW